MADVNDPKIQEAYDEVRKDYPEGTDRVMDWVVCGYEDGSNNKVVVQQSGLGFSFVDQLEDDQVHYVYIRVTAGDKESKRAKFVFLSWIGDNVSVLKKARVSVHKADVKTVFRDFAVELQTSDKADITEEHVLGLVKKAGGAVYTQ